MVPLRRNQHECHDCDQDQWNVLIAIMTFVLSASSGAMALILWLPPRPSDNGAAECLSRQPLEQPSSTVQAIFLTKLIHEGVRPWVNLVGAPRSIWRYLLHESPASTAPHVTIGVIFLLIVARKVKRHDI